MGMMKQKSKKLSEVIILYICFGCQHVDVVAVGKTG